MNQEAPGMHSGDKQPELSVILPAYNEGASIAGVVDALIALGQKQQWEIIVVDDGSDDNTSDELSPYAEADQVRIIRHPYNRGYGAALKTGIRVARAPKVATMDADGQHDPADVLRLLQASANFDLVVGQRIARIHSKLWRMPGKWALSWLANYITGRQIPDLNSGLRIFRLQAVIKYLHLFPDGFSFSTTSTLAFFSRGYSVTYVPIKVQPRSTGSTSKVTVASGFDTLLLILQLASLFQPLRIFLPASGFFIIAGILWGLPFMLLMRGVSVGALLLLITGMLLFFFGLLVDQVAQLRLEKYE